MILGSTALAGTYESESKIFDVRATTSAGAYAVANAVIDAYKNDQPVKAIYSGAQSPRCTLKNDDGDLKYVRKGGMIRGNAVFMANEYGQEFWSVEVKLFCKQRSND